jgi:hypothetical protein
MSATKRPQSRVSEFLFAALIALVTLGCSKSAAVRVHGGVTYRGQPIENASIIFFPTSGRPIDASITNGNYTIELIPGDYVSVVALAIDTPPSYGRTHWNQLPSQKFVLPVEYSIRNKSPLKSSVKQGQKDDINFDLK